RAPRKNPSSTNTDTTWRSEAPSARRMPISSVFSATVSTSTFAMPNAATTTIRNTTTPITAFCSRNWLIRLAKRLSHVTGRREKAPPRHGAQRAGRGPVQAHLRGPRGLVDAHVVAAEAAGHAHVLLQRRDREVGRDGVDQLVAHAERARDPERGGGAGDVAEHDLVPHADAELLRQRGAEDDAVLGRDRAGLPRQDRQVARRRLAGRVDADDLRVALARRDAQGGAGAAGDERLGAEEGGRRRHARARLQRREGRGVVGQRV